MPENAAVLTCRSLCLGYENREVLHGLSFRLRGGECLCVVGENGSGKSTLLRALLGLKKPTHGDVIYGGGLTRKSIGYLPQQSAAQKDFPAKAAEVVRSGFLNAMGARPWYSKAEKQRAAAVMAQLGVADLALRCFRELSGGQQRRVLLARALCAAGGLLLLDEPEAGLDPIAAQELSRLIGELHKEQGIAVIHVTHEIHEALREADLVLHLAAQPGEYFLGTPEEYRNSPLSERFLMK
ncbi:MAG: ATP-binding cassette domain-containing protein [Oscillospiraceae bacterium]|jgi:zinc transport system ATP-binding protein|nr:ATP-binding cassette domain-containing protein [Oscillospiraceae bacterium]